MGERFDITEIEFSLIDGPKRRRPVWRRRRWPRGTGTATPFSTKWTQRTSPRANMPIKDLLKSCEELLEDDFVNEPEELESNVGGGGAHCRDGNRHSDTSGLTDVSYVGAANPPLQHQGSSPQHQVPIEIDSMQGKRPRAFTDSDANAVSRSLASSESPAVEGTSSKRSAFRVVTPGTSRIRQVANQEPEMLPVSQRLQFHESAEYPCVRVRVC
jgi:hypothetical protein